MADRASLSGVALPTDPTDLGEAVRAGYMVDNSGRLLPARTPLIVSGVRAGTVSASLTSDASTGGNLINLTCTGNPTFGLSSPTDHQVIAVHFLALGANRTITFDSASIVPAGGRAMSYLVPQNEVLVAEFRYIGNRGTPRWALTRAEVTGPSSAVAQAEYVHASIALTTTSTTYAAVASSPSLTFVAPPSGIVRLDHSAAMATDNTAGRSAMCAPEVRTGATVGSGTVVLAAADAQAISMTAGTGGNGAEFGRAFTLMGLVPGATYNMRVLHRVNAGTGYYNRIRITATPIGLA